MIKLSIIIPAYNDKALIQRALDSLPLSKEYQYILIDDGSTDNTFEVMCNWRDKNTNKITDYIVLRWQENAGVAKTMNIGFNMAEGEYIVSLSSDDYFIKDFRQVEKYLDGKNDLVYFDLQINNGAIWHLDKESKHRYVGAVKFIRREFLGGTRIPDLKWHEDVPFSEQLYDKNPKEVFTGVVLKHYNYPRVGSLTWKANKENYDKD